MSSFDVLTTNTLCAAKWLQVTLDLYHGLSKSCHHTSWNEINIENAKKDPLYLFNTTKVLLDRDKMSNSIKPKSCQYCWDIEQKAITSDRFRKSASPWSQLHLSSIDLQSKEKICLPSYLEVMFDHTCNLRCLYCSADSSSSIEKEMKKRQSVSQEIKEHRIKRYKKSPFHNDLMTIFFDSLDHILSSLHTLRVTGGEPLLSQHLYQLLDFLLHNKYPNITFGINTNLSLPTKKIINLSDTLNLIKPNIKELQIFISIDTYGVISEAIRKGLNYELFEKNLEILIKNQINTTIIIMVTMTSLSIYSFKKFLKKILLLKKTHDKIIIEITPLKYPSYLSISTLTIEESDELNSCYDFMIAHKEFFSSQEIKNLQVCLYIAKKYPHNSEIIKNRDLTINEIKSL